VSDALHIPDLLDLADGRAATPPLDALGVALLERYQRTMPLVEAPYAAMARELGTTEHAVLEQLHRLRAQRVLVRVGPVFAPHALGASTLAAMAVAPARIDEVAALVSRYDEVNHNYEREHELNLWFVVTAPDAARVAEVLGSVAARTGLEVLDLPLLEPYHIDLGFSLWSGPGEAAAKRACERRGAGPAPKRAPLAALDRRLAAAVEDGLALEPRPFVALADDVGCNVDDVRAHLARLLADGAIKRFGLVVRHHELGFTANAMVVMDVPDERVGTVGHQLARLAPVTLCYRRPRRPPRWRYNLFCMIHGRDREAVMAEAARVRQLASVEESAWAVLFSTRRFKQRGARYARRGARKERAA
jgi:DNA-binding Lrp family transcriptional regulator